jgi:hypothetical protein
MGQVRFKDADPNNGLKLTRDLTGSNRPAPPPDAEGAIGGSFELSLRFLLLLDVSDDAGMTEERLCCLDFICTYAQDFGLDSFNLHGNSSYRFSEFITRQMISNEAVRSLVMKGLVNVGISEHGFVYSLNDSGSHFCKSLQSEYAQEYCGIAGHVSHVLSGQSDSSLLTLIRSKSVSFTQADDGTSTISQEGT